MDFDHHDDCDAAVRLAHIAMRRAIKHHQVKIWGDAAPLLPTSTIGYLTGRDCPYRPISRALKRPAASSITQKTAVDKQAQNHGW